MSPSNDFDSKRTPLFCICHGFYIYVEIVRYLASTRRRFGPENHVRCLSDVRILFLFLKKLSVIRPYKDEKELSVLSVSLSADAWVRLKIVKFWEYDQIQKGSWFNDQAKQTELLLLSKSQSQNYCENIIGNTTLPYELWHLDDLKYESSLDSGQGWMKTKKYRANIGVCSCSPQTRTITNTCLFSSLIQV